MKYFMYEMLKVYLHNSLPTLAAFLLSSMVAEFVADVFLVPWESVKVRIQLNPDGPSHLWEVMPAMLASGGLRAFYGSLVPLWSRQVPLTAVKFTSFELIARLLYSVLRRVDANAKSNIGVTIVTSIAAGFLAGVVSHPADTIVSLSNSGRPAFRKQSGFLTLLRIAHREGLLFKGLELRLLMVCLISIMQWTLYDAVKMFFGFSSSGS
ncbi:solute carrier family 25 (mitochondrial phosphate transporter), member 3 [Strigomonas culicis]|uniref:Solute carrier family 25 (Mitochondrial phosphate transporter), member 3 n=1 Tax=Strigomonas culicis TaxID=28005 RepID=S9U6P3_9TRYP|nr:solute carrier family 25 (mitochondrial phosphate transporter), member 3 [Strigomonas culicis]|eukprot:EPY24464.1 solute carrier family 25 (mitochondrial phosphate transporter), member 3 [Strigomonas culicis]